MMQVWNQNILGQNEQKVNSGRFRTAVHVWEQLGGAGVCPWVCQLQHRAHARSGSSIKVFQTGWQCWQMERKAAALRRLCWLQFNTKMSQILLDLFYRSESFLADGKQRLVQECFLGKQTLDGMISSRQKPSPPCFLCFSCWTDRWIVCARRSS